MDNFEAWVSMTNQGKFLTELNPRYFRAFKSLPWLVNRNLCLKIIKYQNAFLSFHRNIVCKNISCDVGLSEYLLLGGATTMSSTPSSINFLPLPLPPPSLLNIDNSESPSMPNQFSALWIAIKSCKKF